MSAAGAETFGRAMARLASGAEGFAEALSLLDEAARAGNGAAIAKQAHLLAAGVSGPADWDRSLDLLLNAARRGEADAAAELAVLAGGPGTPDDLARRIDIRSFIAPRETRIVCEKPRVRTAPGFMTPLETAWLIERARGRLEPATVYGNETRDAQQVSDRTNRCASYELVHMDMALVLLQTRIATTIGLPTTHFEPAMLLHYRPGEEFRRHVDYLDAAHPAHAADIGERGQRIATFLVSLNDAYEGGGTEFPRVKYTYKGRTGDALVFANTGPDLAPDPLSLHAGLPPTHGEKWLLSQWIRSKPAVG